MAAAVVSSPPPKRGGVHPIFGAFVGGGPLSEDYTIANPVFRSISQLRTIKQLQHIQSNLEAARDTSTGLKFHGNLELDELKSATELDKKNFVEKVELLVETYGFHSFFYMKGVDGKMHSLLSDSHLFTLLDVLADHRSRALPHVPTLGDDGVETPDSVLRMLRGYDVYEEYDCSLSRLAVQSIIGKTLQDDIKTRYSHLVDFAFLPGNVYFLMALEASNASVALDIDGAVSKFNALSLTSFPGENVKGLATEALRLIKIMQGGYCLPLELGSDLLTKVCTTSCERFNRWMHTKLDEVSELELTYKLKDPKLMTSDPLYSTLGPVALCGFLQEKYGRLVTAKAWPALSATLPASNLSPVISDVRRCYHCQSTDHLRDTCPQLGRDGSGGGGRKGRKGRSGGGGTTASADTTPSPETNSRNDGGLNSGDGSSGAGTNNNTRSPFPAWRYIEPVDKASSIVIGDVTYKWCGECRCKATGKKGYFTTSHFTAQHGEKRVTFGPAANNSAVLPSDDDAPPSIAPIVPLAEDSFTPEDVPDQDMLIFSGPWYCPVVDVDCSHPCVWMTSASDEQVPNDENEIVHATILSGLDWVAPDEDEAAIYDALNSDLAPLLDASGLLLSHTEFSSTFDTRPPICVVNLEFADLHACDNSNCTSLGPDGFTCVKCVTGIYYTAIVKCATCNNGTGLLGESCDQCGAPLHGIRILPAPLPGQNVQEYVDDDIDGPWDRNLIRFDYVQCGDGFFPPQINHVGFPICQIIPDQTEDELVFFDSIEVCAGTNEPLTEMTEAQLSSTESESSSALSFSCLSITLVLLSVCKWIITNLTRTMEAFVHIGSKVMNCLCFWHFTCGTLMWDTIELYLNGPQRSLSRRERRRPPRSLPFFPRHWMLLSYLMLCSGYRMWMPLSVVHHALSCTYARCCHISTYVQMSPLVLYDLHTMRFRNLRPSVDKEEVGAARSNNSVPLLSEKRVVSASSEDDMFFDARSDPVFDFLHLDDLLQPSFHLDCVDLTSFHHHPSAPGLNAALSGVNFLDCLAPSRLNRFPVIFDSGASVAITGNRGDFVGELHTPFSDLRLGGMAHGAKVAGIGTVHWTFLTGNGSLTLALRCYYVPDCQARLLSPQRLFNRQMGINGQFVVKEDCSLLEIDGHPTLELEYESTSHLPIALATNGRVRNSDEKIQVNFCITDDSNQNLSPAQKLLLMWHFRFGHKNLPQVQSLLRLPVFQGSKYTAASRTELPKCATCLYAKAHLKSTAGNKSTTNPSTDGALKDGCLHPGRKVSADHFESRLKGRTYSSFGKTTSDQYVGGCIFVDHMSGYIHVEHQLGFSSSETIRAKQNFEQMALGHGVLVEDYLTDNGIFNKTKFVDHIRTHNQLIHYCGVNAHHKNGIAERGIRTVSEIARSLLLHASAHWPTGVDGTLWPMAVDYACYLYNTLPNHLGTCPADLFIGSVAPRHKLRDLHVWGCPVYVLDPTLQQGKKLPRWQPRSRRGLFLGYSPHHSSDVPLILNLQTGSISPQYHVVFDDSFSTVTSIAADDHPPDFWTVVDLEQCISRIPIDANDPSASLLPDDWLTPPELEEKRRRLARIGRIRDTYSTVESDVRGDDLNGTIMNTPADGPSGVDGSIQTGTHSDDGGPDGGGNAGSGGTVISETVPLVSDGADLGGAIAPSMDPVAPSTVESTSIAPSPSGSARRSSRSTKGTFTSTKYIDEVYLSSILDTPRSHHEVELAYRAELDTDFDTGDLNHFDAHAYVAKLKKHDPDNPTYTEAMSGNDAEFYIEAMKQEILALLQQRTWIRVPRSEVPLNPDGTPRKILKGTWAFKLKRLPDGMPLKYKARYCCRGDMQTEGVDYFDTYAPVVQWSTIRLILTLTLKHGWSTRQVDYTNAFAQADIQEEVYIEPPRGFVGKDGIDKVLKLRKSLYGLKQAPKTFFDKLRAGLLERGFTPSNIDPCLFMKQDMICVVYVDDTILCGPNSDMLEQEIQSLGVNNLETRHTFQLRNEGEIGDFLGIRIQKQGEDSFYLTQTGLIDKVLTLTGMENCNAISTPTGREALGSDRDGPAFDEKWKYSAVIGMLLYLSGNTRPDITFAVHQCARFSHNPKHSHSVAVKRILRYLKGTKDKGMVFAPGNDFTVDCYVDADFAGLWGIEYDQDPISVKSRTGYLLMFMKCPLLWVSKMQTQIALSTMEAEYIALSSAMRELIAIREILKELQSLVFQKTMQPTYSMVAKTFDLLPPSKVFEDNDSCLKFASVPRMSPRTKHIAIPYHFFRSKVEQLEIGVHPIDTKKQLADQFTKGLPEEDFIAGRKAVMGW
mmetsp:Transcript_15021/g.28265  ORF Transcript_15021/g.28265 Transcript_15021/m.28265 type:complete len:2300 (+) Transcript_15021:159-7058(+)|eukprot:CAMPEP_0176482282 /NCGR_PEP_ID=MMETSP0200_2-20121128/3290_1 /TAXON_ID=947934 /ORGANISM="Chaetoceros sp., Strain GSL56" /LENGTH=2299 /DNA_ID=CAMNT_0017878583 /DNA_START=130 /DNA_END=7029 /DNA_ORIENTATION=-